MTDAPPPLPPPDDRGTRLRSSVGSERRRLARRRVVRPAVTLVLLLVAFVLLGALQPSSGPLLPRQVEQVQAQLPGWLAGLDLLQILLLPFLLLAALEVVRGAYHLRQARRAWLRIDRIGRLEQVDGDHEHIDLDHLVAVDVAPNSAFTAINERSPLGSLLVLRLIDATGQGVDVNPGMWAEEVRIIDTIRHYAWHGDATISPEAAERYGLPVRGRGGHEHAGATAVDDTPLHTEEAREAALRERGIELQRAADRAREDRDGGDQGASGPSGPALERTTTRRQAQGDPAVGEGGVEVEGGAEVEPRRLDDQ